MVKIFKHKLWNKQEEEQKYDDWIAAGHTAVKASYDTREVNVIKLGIGILQPNKYFTISVKILTKCQIFKHGFYSFVLPWEFINDFDTTTMELRLTSDSTVTNLHASHKWDYEWDKDKKNLKITNFDFSEDQTSHVVISYSTKNIRRPSLTFYKSDKFPDQIAAMLNFIPRISDEHDIESGMSDEGKIKFMDMNFWSI